MKKLLGILVLILFTLQTPSLTDDIRDLQIEGMSVGDSLLDYMSKNEIKNAEQNSTYMKDKKFIIIYSPSKSEVYDDVQITYKPKDNKYLIHALDGKIYFKNNIKACKKKRKEIVNEIKDMFKDAKITKEEVKHSYDKSGKTTVTRTYFLFKSNDYVDVYCNDWSPEMFKKHRWVEDLGVSIGSSEYRTFLFEAYK